MRAILAGTLLCLLAPPAARAQRTLSADVYLDKARGMWMGQLLGNTIGRPYEGHVTRGGLSDQLDWGALLAAETWTADDDTSLEYLYLEMLSHDVCPDGEAIRDAWEANTNLGRIWIANRQARLLMEPPPTGKSLLPPETGRISHNMHWGAIDAQIATESLGALLPGMRQRAADLCQPFATVTNDGYAVFAAQFYAAMVSAAAFETDVERVVEQGLAVVPATARSGRVVRAVRDRYLQDKAAGLLGDPNAWRAAQEMLYDDYGYVHTSHYRYRGWTESTVNLGMTALALLYGGGDFKRTVEIAVQGGWDADCNPATAGGVIGMMRGYAGADGNSGILAELPAVPADTYRVTELREIGTTTSVSGVAARFAAAAEAQLLAAGGAIDGNGAGRVYVLPDEALRPPAEQPDPGSAAGLVGRVRAAGGEVTVSASIESRDPTRDRYDLDGIADGIVDVRYNGHMPYWTISSSRQDDEDFYALTFPRPMTFASVVFHEGDIVWSGINSNPRLEEPRGGWFTDLTVEILDLDGVFRQVDALSFDEPLDANTFYQHIELSFEPACGTAVRIRGTAGGTRTFTTIVELEAFGAMGTPGDADEDGDVDADDMAAFRAGFGRAGGWADGDFTFDGVVDADDYAAVKRHWGTDFSGGFVPEPGAAGLLALLAGAGLAGRLRCPRGRKAAARSGRTGNARSPGGTPG